jgi:TP901 family phage tail tape measure protein
MNFNIGFTISPDLDARKLNELLGVLKSKLGALGVDIELFTDEDVAQFSKLTKGTEDLARGLKNDADSAKGIGVALDDMENKAKSISGMDMSKAFRFNQITQAVTQVSQALGDVVNVGAEFGANMDAVQAVTGASAETMDKLGASAREMALQFGGEASTQLKSFQGILSKLGPQMADSPAALAKMAENVNILSAASGDAADTSMNAIVDTMLQLGLATGDAAKDAETSTRVINALAASAQVGAAEIPQVAESMLQVGVAAKGAGLSLEATNAAIQVLAVGGKTGSEAGVALRNVLGLIQNASGPAEQSMAKLGTSSKELGEILTTQGLDAALNKMKAGMEGLNSQAEKNVALMDIFGSENSAAAGILLDNVPKLKEFENGIKAGQLGMGSAFEQASVRMDNAQTMIGQATAFIKDQMLGAFSAMGDGVSAAVGATAQIAPMVTTFAGLKDVIPTDSIKNFAGSIKDVVLPALVKMGIVRASAIAATVTETAATTANTGAKVAQATATGGATVAQGALNAVMALNPAFLVVAGIAALVGAFVYFSDTTKDLETAMADANTALDDFNKAAAEADTVKDQAKSLDELADKYDALSQAKTPEGIKEFNDTAKQLAAAVPESAEAIDEYNAAGQRVGTTFNVSTESVRAFSAEQKKMAEEAKASALQVMQDQAAALVDSYREATEQLSESKKEQAEVNSLTLEQREAMDALDGPVTNLIGLTQSHKEKTKEVNAAVHEQSKKQQEARAALQTIVQAMEKQNKSAKEIAAATGLTEKEVRQLSGTFGLAAKSAELTAKSAIEIKAATENATKSAKDLAEAYKAVKKAANDALDTNKGAYLALAREQESATKELSEVNRKISAETNEVIKNELLKTQAFLQQRLKDIPARMKELREAARQALQDQKKLEREEKVFDLSIGAINYNVQDFAEQAAKIRAEIGQIANDIAIGSLKDQADALRLTIKTKADTDVNAITAQIKEVKKRVAAAANDNDPTTTTANSNALINALLAKQRKIREKQAQDEANAEKTIQENRLKSIREALNKELALRGDHLTRLAETFERESDRIIGEEEEDIDTRLAKQLSALSIHANAAYERLLSSSDKFVDAWGALQSELQAGEEDMTADQRLQWEERVRIARTNVGNMRSAVLEFLKLQDLQKIDRTKLTPEEQGALDTQIAAIKKRLEEEGMLTAEAQNELLKAWQVFEDKRTDLTDKANEERLKKAVEKLKAEYAERLREIEQFTDAQQKRLLDTQQVLDKFIEDMVRDEGNVRLMSLKNQFDNLLLSQEDFDRRRVEMEEETNKKIEGMKQQSAGIQMEIERRRQVEELNALKDHLTQLVNTLPKGSAESLKAQDDLDKTTKKIKEQGDTLTLIGQQASDAFTDIVLSATAGQLDSAKERFRAFLNMMLGAVNALASVKITEVLLGSIPEGASVFGLFTAAALKPVIEKLIQGFLSIGIAAVARFGDGGSLIPPGQYNGPTTFTYMVGDMPVAPQKEWVFTDRDLRSVVGIANAEMATAFANSMQEMIGVLQAWPTKLTAHGKQLRLASERDANAEAKRTILSREANWGT